MAATGCENLAPSASPSPAQAGTSPIGCVLPCLPPCPSTPPCPRTPRFWTTSTRLSSPTVPASPTSACPPPCCAQRPISASTPPLPSRTGPSPPCSTATTSQVLRK